MRYVQFFTLSTGYIAGTIPPKFDRSNRELIPSCGSDAVMRMDKRQGLGTAFVIAANECKRRGYLGFQIMEGRSYSDACAVTELMDYAPREVLTGNIPTSFEGAK